MSSEDSGTRATEAGVAHDVTLVEVLAELAQSGYTGDVVVHDDGQVCCRACNACQTPSSLHLDGLRRLEGASDPADLATVLAVTCPNCGARAAAVVRYGPEASAGEATLLRHIDDRRPGDGLDVAEDAAT